jgi:Zn-dependent M32 family carboxypeptidase
MPAKGTPAARAAHAQQAKVQAAREQELRAQHEQAAAKQRAQAAAARERNIQDVKRMQAQAAQIDRALQTAMIRVGDRARKVWQASIAPSVGELVKAIRNYAVLYNRLVARGVRPAKTPDQIFKGILDSIYDPVVRAATHRAIRVGVAARK